MAFTNITNLINPAATLDYGVTSATATFSMNGNAPLTTTVTQAANGTTVTVASTVGFSQGDIIATETANTDGIASLAQQISFMGGTTNGTFTVGVPNSRVWPLNGVVTTKTERIEQRFHPNKLVLTDLTNGDTFSWDISQPYGTTAKVAGADGAQSTLTYNGIYVHTNAIAIHPNILAAGHNFKLDTFYDYYVPYTG